MAEPSPSDSPPWRDRGLSAVLPAYNEQESIAQAIESLRRVLLARARPFEIIVVDDGSTDRTGAIADELAQKHPTVRVIHHDGNRGYGAALRSGFAAATHPLVFYTDSDNQFRAEEIDRLLERIDEADIVTGYRIGRQDSWKRRVGSWAFRRFARAAFGIWVRDVDCAFKLYRREVFDKVVIQSDHYFVDTEVLAKAAFVGYLIDEVGVTHLARRAGQTKVHLRDALSTLREAWRVFRDPTFPDLSPDASGEPTTPDAKDADKADPSHASDD